MARRKRPRGHSWDPKNIIGKMKKPIAVLFISFGIGTTVFAVNAEVFGDAVAAKCTVHSGQIVCVPLQIVTPDATTRGTSLDWRPPYWS